MKLMTVAKRITLLAGAIAAQGCVVGRIAHEQIPDLVHGYTAPGFEEVRETFIANFRERGELGAACAVYYRGELVVDLWGGYSHFAERRRWTRETMVPVFSTTKGLAAMTLAVAHARGWLDYDAPVAKYWPEFAQEGKKAVTVRELLGHRAGLVLFDADLSVEDLRDLDSVAAFLARQKPQWAPGTRQGYHSSTLGLYMNALLTRVDPRHRSLGTFFHEEIAVPLGLRFHIGLPDDVPDSLVAHIEMASPIEGLLHMSDVPLPMLMRMISPWSYLSRSFGVPKGFDNNDRATWSIEAPSGNGIGDARSIARAYAEFASGGWALGLRDATMLELSWPASAAFDEVLGITSSYSLGFSRPHPASRFGSDGHAFGTPGAGGSFGFADPMKDLGYAYVMTRMGYRAGDDPRETALQATVYRCIARLEAEEDDCGEREDPLENPFEPEPTDPAEEFIIVAVPGR